MSALHDLLSTPLLAEAAPPGAPDMLGTFAPMALVFVIFYVLILRPMNKDEKDRKVRVSTLSKGDQVVIGGGVLGRLTNVEDPQVAVVEIADKVRIKVLKKDIVDSQDHALAKDKKSGGDKDKKKAE